MTIAMHKPQIHEVLLAPVLLCNHMVYVGFLAIFQVLVTPWAEPPFAVGRAGDSETPWQGFWHVAVANSPGGLDHRGKRSWGRADAAQSWSRRISGGWHDALCPQRPSGPAEGQWCAPSTSWFSTSLISVGGGVSCSAARGNT